MKQLIDVINDGSQAIRCVRTNKQPILLPKSFVTLECYQCNVNDDEIGNRARLILEAKEFQTRVGQAIKSRHSSRRPSAYVEERIFDGIPGPADELLMQQFHQVSWEQRAEVLDRIADARVRELGYRLIYLEKPDALSSEKRAELDTWRVQRLK